MAETSFRHLLIIFHDVSFHLLGKDNETYVTYVVINLIANTQLCVPHPPTAKERTVDLFTYHCEEATALRQGFPVNDFNLKFSKTTFIMSPQRDTAWRHEKRKKSFLNVLFMLVILFFFFRLSH